MSGFDLYSYRDRTLLIRDEFTMQIQAPVSVGELIDKITILQIKLERLHATRAEDYSAGARASTFATLLAYHLPPRGVLIPRAFKASAI
jgi:uncharacterized small protein (DUF1192 family)